MSGIERELFHAVQKLDHDPMMTVDAVHEAKDADLAHAEAVLNNWLEIVRSEKSRRPPPSESADRDPWTRDWVGED